MTGSGDVGASLTGEKFLILIGMLVCTLVFGFIPRFLTSPSRRADPRWRRTISALSCFSGGVFVGACLLDLFPDVRESIDNVLDEIEDVYHTKVDYPVAEFVIVLGFFLVLLIEQIVLEFGVGQQQQQENDEEGQGRETSPLLRGGEAGGGDHLRHHGTFGHQQQQRSRLLSHEEDDDEEVEEGSVPTVEYLSGTANDGQGHEHSHHHHQHVVLDHSSLRSYLLILALTFHSVFEGLAIGLQQVTGQLFSIFVAVMIHKAVMAFSLGLTIAQSPRITRRMFAASILVFSLASPFGMAIGIALTDMEASLGRDVANGMLQGLSGGTFLYITFFEVLPSELGADCPNDYSRMIKFLFVIIGYSCICGILFFTH